MNKKIVLLIVLLVFVAVLIGAYVLYDRLGEDAAPEQLAVTDTSEPEDIPAPDFTVYDIEGNEVHLSDYLGKPVVLNFWASWCGPCKMEMPDFNEKYLEIGDEVSFVMVNMTDGSQETLASASEFISESGYDFPVFYDTAYSAMIAYGVNSLPTSFFIDAQGNVAGWAPGAIDAETLQRGIDRILE